MSAAGIKNALSVERAVWILDGAAVIMAVNSARDLDASFLYDRNSTKRKLGKMEISQEEFDDLRAQATAQKLLINAILIGLVDKKVFTNADIEVLVESTIASLDEFQDPILEKAVPYLDHFRIASQQGE
ncbi:MAG: hypothetical protein P4L53_05745 [Candidatus Obscuribacterales bacterium]|nr:hypothetical protein [Candidatus Obscuribacterales bacterium]